MVFSINVEQTLQLFYPSLQKQESANTLDFLCELSGDAPRKNILQVGDHMYFVGKTQLRQFSTAECQILGKPPNSTALSAGRCFYKGTLYHSTAYLKGQGKRNCTVCSFIDGSVEKFGQIEFFTNTSEPIAVIRVFERTGSSLLTRTENPCRDILNEYKRIDYIDSFITEIKVPNSTCDIQAIPVRVITGKAIHLRLFNSNYEYVLKQPNN